MLLASAWAKPSLALGLILVGDSLLYAVLPGAAQSFGVSAWGVGILLASNRVIRLVGMPSVTRAVAHWGMRPIMICAVAAAALTCVGYALLSGLLQLWPLRLVWGLVFGASYLCMLNAAAFDGAKVGTRIGLASGLSKLPALLALILAPWAISLVGLRGVFAIAAAIAVMALPIAMRVPSIPVTARQRVFGWPTARDRLMFAVALSVDGVLVAVAGLLFASSATSAVFAASVVLASQQAADILLAPLAGWVCDHHSPRYVLLVASVGIASGLTLIACGFLTAAVILVVVFRPMVTPAVYADARTADTGLCLTVVGRLATWRDAGAAIGPIFALASLAGVGRGILFAGLALLIAIATVQWSHRGRLS